MTARARATALALVNWKGVFYERYLIDRFSSIDGVARVISYAHSVPED